MHTPSDPGARKSTEPQHGVDALFTRVYAELKGLAHRVRAGRGPVTLDTTALVHETYIKLAGSSDPPWKSDSHFFAIAARAMRQVLIDLARQRMAQKRGGTEPLVMTYDDAMHSAPVRPDDLVALDEALEALAQFDARKAQVVEMRFFGGLTEAEIAAALDVSSETVRRDWRLARSWLRRKLSGEQND